MPSRNRPITKVAVGEALYRIHVANLNARFYGKRDGTWRWDDPAGGYGVLYVGLTQEGPFAETLLRRPAEQAVVWSEVEKRRWARFRTIDPLRLADVHGKRIIFQGTTVAQVSGDHDGKKYPGAYANAQAISAEIHATTDLDGIAYRSRLEPDQLCLALFDRADHKIELVESGLRIDRAWVDDLLESHGKYVIDI